MPHPSEAPLAYLGFRLLAPSPHLRPYVHSYWSFQRETPLTTYHDEYMHPTGGFGLVFNFGDLLRLDAQAVAEPVFLDGVNTVSRQLGFRGRVELLGVRFHAGGAYPFLGAPLNELRNETALVEAAARRSLQELQARLQETAAPAARLQLLDQWLIGRLRLGKERHAIIPASLTWLREAAGPRSIPALAETLASSQRQLERLYQTQVGMSPKQYAQLLRIEAARLALKRQVAWTTTHLAAELDFYDQSHFIREFSAVIGMTPSAYLQRANLRRPRRAKSSSR